jgi:predicted RNA-binding protein YlxR (DUF448 family)
MTGKHIPQRTCVGCREVQGKRQMIRIVRRADEQVLIDPTGKAPGRGAYVHVNQTCWQAALNQNRLTHALRVEHLSEENRLALQAYAAALPKEESKTV